MARVVRLLFPISDFRLMGRFYPRWVCDGLLVAWLPIPALPLRASVYFRLQG